MPDPRCCICKVDTGSCRLVRLTWAEDGRGAVSPVFGRLPSMVVAAGHEPEGICICIDCIREIKRLPFTALGTAPIVWRDEDEP
jgi:hypothetical protein